MTLTSNLPSVAPASQSFRAWCRDMSLAESLSRAEADVRAKPQDAGARWLLFELLCLLGHWERALRQLQFWAGLSREHDSTAHLMRGLIRAEVQRAEVFAGRLAPGTLTAPGVPAPDWVEGLAEALRLSAVGDAASMEASDRAREDALARAPEVAGQSNVHASFAWITDSDSRLGPVCEVTLMGAYRWLPFPDVASLTMSAPTGLLDLVWAPVELTLRGNHAVKGYLPARYPVATDRPSPRDALLLARETVWHDVGRTGTHAQGQKMWMTDSGDLALLDLRTCVFTAGAPAGRAEKEEKEEGDGDE